MTRPVVPVRLPGDSLTRPSSFQGSGLRLDLRQAAVKNQQTLYSIPATIDPVFIIKVITDSNSLSYHALALKIMIIRSCNLLLECSHVESFFFTLPSHGRGRRVDHLRYDIVLVYRPSLFEPLGRWRHLIYSAASTVGAAIVVRVPSFWKEPEFPPAEEDAR
jgi:hypothetical protein